MVWPALSSLLSWCAAAVAAAHRMGLTRCKTHAASLWHWWAGLRGAGLRTGCHTASHQRDSVAQGLSGSRGDGLGAGWGLRRRLLASALVLAAASVPAAPRCAGPALRFEPLAPDLWLLRGAEGAPGPANRGRVANLLIGRDAQGLWLLGSGPSPAIGRALACQAPQALGAPLRAVVSPWARPELVMGVAGLGAVEHWAHASVAQAMASQCPQCAARLRGQLGAAGAELGPGAIRLPARRLAGESGSLGPWHWWRLPRDDQRWVTVWRWQAAPLWFAPGLLAEDGVPDGHDADLATLQASLQRLQALAEPDGPAARWLGDRGGPQPADAPARSAAYWQALLAAATQALLRADAETDPPPPLPGVPAAWQQQAGHALNWQRAWRQVEPLVLDTAPAR